MKLCPRGYCTAKSKFKVYPSAYANGYASQVCSGATPDFENRVYNDYEDVSKDVNSDLSRWYREQWVNVCEDGYPPCGRKKAVMNMKTYPYCRPLYKLRGTKVKSVGEMTSQELSDMCQKKRSISPGTDGKPTRVYVK
jgi:hypothetical protein